MFILKDPWLPYETDPMVKDGPQSLQGAKVSSLFLVGKKEWDVDLIKDLFSVEEACCILGIPLSSRRDDDYWYWLKEKVRCIFSKKCL